MARRGKQKIFHSRRRFRRARGSRAWPYAVCAMALAAVALLVYLLVAVVVPFFGRLFGGEQPQVLMPTPTPEQAEDLSGYIREVLLVTNLYPHVSAPVILGDEIFLAAGMDNARNPKLDEIYVVKADEASSAAMQPVEGILAQGDILSLDVNADYIVYFDGQKTGGGLLMAYSRAEKRAWQLKQVQSGWPTVALCGGTKVVFNERTDAQTERLYMLDILTGENTTLAVYENSPLGLCTPGVCDTAVAYVAPDPDRPDSTQYNLIYLQPIDGSQARVIEPGMYAYNPVTNGSSVAWSDGMGNASASLYVSVNGGMSRKLADNVSGYGMADNFVAWSEQGRIYTYDLNTGKKGRVSRPAEYALLASVSHHAVAWFDITAEKREQDILKFAILD